MLPTYFNPFAKKVLPDKTEKLDVNTDSTKEDVESIYLFKMFEGVWKMRNLAKK